MTVPTSGVTKKGNVYRLWAASSAFGTTTLCGTARQRSFVNCANIEPMFTIAIAPPRPGASVH